MEPTTHMLAAAVISPSSSSTPAATRTYLHARDAVRHACMPHATKCSLQDKHAFGTHTGAPAGHIVSGMSSFSRRMNSHHFSSTSRLLWAYWSASMPSACSFVSATAAFSVAASGQPSAARAAASTHSAVSLLLSRTADHSERKKPAARSHTLTWLGAGPPLSPLVEPYTPQPCQPWCTCAQVAHHSNTSHPPTCSCAH